MAKKRNPTLATSAPTSGAATKATSSAPRKSTSEVSTLAPAPPVLEASAATPAPGDWPASTTTKRDEKKARSLGIISTSEGNVILPGAECFLNVSDDNLEGRNSSIPAESHTEENAGHEDEDNDPANPEALSTDPKSFADDISDTTESNHDDDADRAAFVDAAAEKANVQPPKRSSGGFADEDDFFDLVINHHIIKKLYCFSKSDGHKESADIPSHSLDKLPDNSPANALSMTIESSKVVEALLRKNKEVLSRMHAMIFPNASQEKTLEQLMAAFAVDTKDNLEVTHVPSFAESSSTGDAENDRLR
ncbi:hypothetical protein QYE76_060810 [Lolium multiflorum]|uniref:Uncharacterized protein n=1 Tax=Lolium multiflorum TaxID=4521 RepID=A0AAD8S224_LOLMU|nr:hypothetical protein QYE76_060810 [Lolium multiflorum]